MSPKPTFLLIHGAWHTPHCWTRLTPLLTAAGHQVLAPQMPTSGSVPPVRTWDADITTICDAVRSLAQQGRDIVVVLHSNAGITGSTALHGFDKASCAAQGWSGGVVRIVYVAAFMVPEGFRHSTPGTRENVVSEMQVDMEGFVMTVAPEHVKGLMYQDLSDEEVGEVVPTLVPQSLASLYGTTEFAAWRSIPTTYVVTLGDAPSTLVAMRHLIKAAKESEPNMVDTVIEEEVGHAPFWSKPEWCARMLIEQAERKD
ncbi:alpha/beta-hydrolase [Polyplosphaeria fusca]|uniref:Alpha/beta-hydrolase n=1 Tax=Polyplosphaeria fusca TaxID=682080 RepID=A0A9P4QRR3_9PLEO|nr:alpha/beta-hydrolase [Polyplosphaeria fusca]